MKNIIDISEFAGIEDFKSPYNRLSWYHTKKPFAKFVKYLVWSSVLVLVILLALTILINSATAQVEFRNAHSFIPIH